MYEIVKNTILAKNYELSNMLKKIDTLWVQGDLTEEQRLELIDMARENALSKNSYASYQAQIDALVKMVSELNTPVSTMLAELEKVKEAIEKMGGTVEPPEPEPEPDEWLEYKDPTGAYDAYHNGDKVTFEGKHYICIAPEGVAVVWSPTTYLDYWQLQEQSETVTW